MVFSILVGMADIASRSGYATTGLVCDIHQIARSLLHQIGEEHRIAGYEQETSTSHGPSIRPPVSSTVVRMQPIRGRGRGRGRVDRQGRGIDGGRGHGPDGESGRGTPEPILPTSIPPHTYPSPSIPPQNYTSPPIPPHTYTSSSIPPHTYTSPSIPLDTYTSLPYPVLPEPASIAVDITFSSPPLSSPILPSIDDTILYLVSELGPLPAMRPHAPRVCRVLHPSAPSASSAPSAPFHIPRDPIAQQAVYSRCRPKRNIKTPSCGTH